MIGKGKSWSVMLNVVRRIEIYDFYFEIVNKIVNKNFDNYFPFVYLWLMNTSESYISQLLYHLSGALPFRFWLLEIKLAPMGLKDQFSPKKLVSFNAQLK
jgi:hypothetical protein